MKKPDAPTGQLPKRHLEILQHALGVDQYGRGRQYERTVEAVMKENTSSAPAQQIHGPTFGQTLRGMRLGYRWSSKHQAMVRISDCGPHFEVRLCPPDQLPKGPERGNKEYRCWWEENAVDVLSLIFPLRGIKAVRGKIRFVVDNDGRLVGGAA